MVASLTSASESGGGMTPLPAKQNTKLNQNNTQMVLGSKMTRMTKAKRAQRKTAKARVKSKVKAKNNAKADENGKVKAKTNGPQLNMRTRYSMKQSAPISVLKTSGQQPSTEMQKKEARLSEQFCKIERQKQRFISSCYGKDVGRLIETSASDSVECEPTLSKSSNGHGNAIYHISSFAAGY